MLCTQDTLHNLTLHKNRIILTIVFSFQDWIFLSRFCYMSKSGELEYYIQFPKVKENITNSYIQIHIKICLIPYEDNLNMQFFFFIVLWETTSFVLLWSTNHMGQCVPELQGNLNKLFRKNLLVPWQFEITYSIEPFADVYILIWKLKITELDAGYIRLTISAFAWLWKDWITYYAINKTMHFQILSTDDWIVQFTLPCIE